MTDTVDPGTICRIVIIRPNHRLGNNLLLTPLLGAIEDHFPGAEVELVTAGGAAEELFRGYRQLRTVHAFPARGYAGPLATARVLSRVLQRHYDLAIDPIPRSRSARFLLGLIKARHRIGYEWGASLPDAVLTRRIATDVMPRHMASFGVDLLRQVFPRPYAQPASRLPLLDLRLTAAERALGADRIDRILGTRDTGARLRIGLYAAATGLKCYSSDWWQTLVCTLRSASDRIELLEFVPHDGHPRLQGMLPLVYSTRPRDLAAAITATSLFVSADCGVMHLASAAGARVLGLFKVTDAVKYAPYGNGSAVAHATDADPAAVVHHIQNLLGAGPEFRDFVTRTSMSA